MLGLNGGQSASEGELFSSAPIDCVRRQSRIPDCKTEREEPGAGCVSRNVSTKPITKNGSYSRVRSTQPPGACSREKKGRESGESTFRSDSPVPLPFCPPSAEVGVFGAASPSGRGREKDVLLIALSSAGKIKHRVRPARGRANVFEAKLTTIKKLAFLRSERVSLSEPRRSLPKLAQILTENARARA